MNIRRFLLTKREVAIWLVYFALTIIATDYGLYEQSIGVWFLVMMALYVVALLIVHLVVFTYGMALQGRKEVHK